MAVGQRPADKTRQSMHTLMHARAYIRTNRLLSVYVFGRQVALPQSTSVEWCAREGAYLETRRGPYHLKVPLISAPLWRPWVAKATIMVDLECRAQDHDHVVACGATM